MFRIILKLGIKGGHQEFDLLPDGRKRYFKDLMSHQDKIIQHSSRMEEYRQADFQYCWAFPYIILNEPGMGFTWIKNEYNITLSYPNLKCNFVKSQMDYVDVLWKWLFGILKLTICILLYAQVNILYSLYSSELQHVLNARYWRSALV